MSPSSPFSLGAIPIAFTYIRCVVGTISDFYEMEFIDPLPLDAKIPQPLLDSAYRTVNNEGCLEIVYLALTFLLQSETEDLKWFHMGEQEWSQEEMRHLIQEIKSNWFPTPQPQLDALVSRVFIGNVGGTMETWWKEVVPELVAGLPKIQVP